MRQVHWILIAMGALLGGCFGSPMDLGVGMTDLVEAESASEPLAKLGNGEDWQSAPAGCEGRLPQSTSVRFRVASLEDGLVAAVDDEGEIVCVDTVEAVTIELEEMGEGGRAVELDGAFFATASLSLATNETRYTNRADPTPQPNLELSASHSPSAGSGGQSSDPTPQPNRGP